MHLVSFSLHDYIEMHGRQNIEKMQVKRRGSASAANKLFIVTEMDGLTKKMFPPLNATTCPLWTSWSSLLGMAGV